LIIHFEDYCTISHEGYFTGNGVCILNSFDQLGLLRVNHKLSCIFSTNRAFPCSISSRRHKGNEGLQIKALSMNTFETSDWSLDYIPGEWIIEIYHDFIDFNVIRCGLH
jgi:hypothetical protein